MPKLFTFVGLQMHPESRDIPRTFLVRLHFATSRIPGKALSIDFNGGIPAREVVWLSADACNGVIPHKPCPKD